MRVRSPKLNSSNEDTTNSPSSVDRSTQLATFDLDNDTNHFLLKHSVPSHLGDPKAGVIYIETNGKLEGDKVCGKGSWNARRAWSALIQPFTWIAMLCRELDTTFVFGVMVVYGVSQGIGFALNRVVVDYYWKDVQGEQPSMVQFYRGITWVPWDVKPLYGLLTDLLPLFGYHRRPYFLLSGIITISTYLILVFGGKLHVGTALTMFVGGSTAAAIADVTIDALVAMKSRERPELATHIQTLCGTCQSLGSLSGFLLSGLAVHILGSQGALGAMLVPGVLLLLLGFVIYEPRLPRHLWYSREIGQQMTQACSNMWSTLKQVQVWQPTMYMYLSWALAPDISEGKFFWYNDSSVGPGFSEEFVGVIYAMGSVGTLLGVAIYHKHLRHWTFRSILLWAQLLLALSGMLDLMLVTRVNLKLLMPDYVFAVVDEAASQAIGRIKWMPLLVLAAKLCPPGIEGTFYALLMSVDNVGMLSAAWVGSVLLKVVGVTRTNFHYLWLSVLIRNFMRLLPLPFLLLVPNTNPDLPILPPEPRGTSLESTEEYGRDRSESEEDNEGVNLVALPSSKEGTYVEYI